MTDIKITQRQTPCFRALIKEESSGDLFDPDSDLATSADLAAEGLTNVYPISYSVYKTQSKLYYTTEAESTPVTGYQNVEIDADALINPATVATNNLDYNFSFTPEARSTFPFASPGVYYVDFMIYPKDGAAIVWRTWLTVQ